MVNFSQPKLNDDRARCMLSHEEKVGVVELICKTGVYEDIRSIFKRSV